jgi:hypothetical protein
MSKADETLVPDTELKQAAVSEDRWWIAVLGLRFGQIRGLHTELMRAMPSTAYRRSSAPDD